MFDLVAGFCHSQILQAFVRLKLPEMLLEREMTAAVLAEEADVPDHGMAVLLSGSVAIGLIKRRRSGRYALTKRGAALASMPGLAGMINHHDILYMDMADPVAFFRGQVETELAEFWPYKFGKDNPEDDKTVAAYSQLMADSQVLVAEDTLAVVEFKDAYRVMDVGGGTGGFLTAVGQAYPEVSLTLFDLPAVIPDARTRFENANMLNRVELVAGPFHEEELPTGADLITLVRVLYDHDDDVVASLLTAVYDALPPDGRVVISEPMTGGSTPNRAGDAYFALYCMALRTGRARSAAQVSALLKEAGFSSVSAPKAPRPFITSVVTGVK